MKLNIDENRISIFHVVIWPGDYFKCITFVQVQRVGNGSKWGW